MGLRKRLRKRGYVLMSDERADSIIDLRKQLGVRHRQLGLAIERNSRRAGRQKELIAEMDVLEAKYQLAIDRIIELAGNDE